MELLQRNQLVWLKAQAWQNILAAPWDPQALEILRHWAAAALPLVVARQRSDVSKQSLCLGLPAPARWARRRLAVDVDAGDISKVDLFPLLCDVLPGGSPVALSDLSIRVYGSYGWQAITGLDYVHGASDIDVLLYAGALSEALRAAKAVKRWSASCRVDGEVVFPSGHAVAWRELLQAHSGAATQVLVKHRQSAALVTLPELERLTRVRRNARLAVHSYRATAGCTA